MRPKPLTKRYHLRDPSEPNMRQKTQRQPIYKRANRAKRPRMFPKGELPTRPCRRGRPRNRQAQTSKRQSGQYTTNKRIQRNSKRRQYTRGLCRVGSKEHYPSKRRAGLKRSTTRKRRPIFHTTRPGKISRRRPTKRDRETRPLPRKYRL